MEKEGIMGKKRTKDSKNKAPNLKDQNSALKKIIKAMETSEKEKIKSTNPKNKER